MTKNKTDMEKVSDGEQQEKEFVPVVGTMPDSNPEEKKSKESVFGSRQKRLVLISLSLFWFTVSCAYAMISPFFPGEVSNDQVLTKINKIQITPIICRPKFR